MYQPRSPMQYLLPCSCGESIPLDVTQAGQTVTCRCGKTQQAPSLLKIKKLQPVDRDLLSASRTVSTFNAQLFFLCLGCIVSIPSAIFLHLALFWTQPVFGIHPFWTYPTPPNVLAKQKWLTYGDNLVWQDSTPLPSYERRILLTHPEEIDDMLPFRVFDHFRTLKNGPMLSQNFQENYETLKDAHRIRVSVGIIGIVLGLLCLGVSLFAPKKTKTVGVRKGAEWK